MEQYSKYILNKLIKVGQNPDGVFYIKEKRLSDEHRNNILTEGQNLGYNEVYINEIINQLIVYNPSQEDLKMIFENSDVEFIKYSDDKKKFQVRGKYIGTYLGDIVGSEKAENYKWEEAKEYIKFTADIS